MWFIFCTNFHEGDKLFIVKNATSRFLNKKKIEKGLFSLKALTL